MDAPVAPLTFLLGSGSGRITRLSVESFQFDGAGRKTPGLSSTAASRCAGIAIRVRIGLADLQRIAKEKGFDFDLWNREARCRVTPGCKVHVRILCGGRGMLLSL